MAPLNKQDEPYLEQNANMSTLQPSGVSAQIVAGCRADPASARRNRCGSVLPVRFERWRSATSGLSEQDGINSLLKVQV